MDPVTRFVAAAGLEVGPETLACSDAQLDQLVDTVVGCLQPPLRSLLHYAQVVRSGAAPAPIARPSHASSAPSALRPGCSNCWTTSGGTPQSLATAGSWRRWTLAPPWPASGLGFTNPSRAFARFERLQAEAAKPGTGAGLAIAQRVVGRAGGRIWLESATGGGTTIFFTAPAVTLNPPTGPSDYGVMESSKAE